MATCDQCVIFIVAFSFRIWLLISSVITAISFCDDLCIFGGIEQWFTICIFCIIQITITVRRTMADIIWCLPFHIVWIVILVNTNTTWTIWAWRQRRCGWFFIGLWRGRHFIEIVCLDDIWFWWCWIAYGFLLIMRKCWRKCCILYYSAVRCFTLCSDLTRIKQRIRVRRLLTFWLAPMHTLTKR